jgi:hypothetical protein
MTETQEAPRGADAVQNAATHSENTQKHCAYRGEVIKAVVKLREMGYSLELLC